MDDDAIQLELQKLKSEIDSIREVIRPLLLDLEERRSTYAMLTGRLN
jgi:predicted CopG family antitoxin